MVFQRLCVYPGGGEAKRRGCRRFGTAHFLRLVESVLDFYSIPAFRICLGGNLENLQLTERFKCDRKVLTPKPRRRSRVKRVHIRRVALPLLKCDAGRLFPFSYGRQILLSSYLDIPEFQNHHNVSEGLKKGIASPSLKSSLSFVCSTFTSNPVVGCDSQIRSEISLIKG